MLIRRPGILGLSLLCCVISGTSPNFSEPNILFFIPCHQTRSSSFTLYWRHLTLWLSVPQFLLLAAPRLHSPSSHLTVSLSFSPSFSISYSSVDLQTVGAPCTSVFNPFFVFTSSLSTGMVEDAARSAFRIHPDSGPSPQLPSWFSPHQPRGSISHLGYG